MRLPLLWPTVWLIAATAAAAEVDFERHVAPVLVRHCLACHNASEPSGGLDLTQRAKVLIGGDSGAAITPGDTDSSYLLERVRSAEMPPEGKGTPLAAADVEQLERWIASGAAWPESRVLSPFEFTTDNRAGLDWWSLARPQAPAIPAVSRPDWLRTPIDAFVLARLEAQGLSPAPEADRATLIRRLSLDVVGLPPAPEAIDAFVADPAADAYERLVDRLLASPHYGERWARHWLDVARFGESHGYEKNLPRPNAWPYRDWVIEAFNRDLAYPDFILHQLAGDQFGVDAATGFLVGGAHDEVGSPDVELTRQQRVNDLDDMLSTTSTAFLGLTAGCAKCHDHKFDPISQHDYYALQGIFAGVEHGRRELRTPDHAERRRRADQLQHELDGLERQADDLVARHQPLAQLDASAGQPPRAAVHPRLNIDRFAPRPARLVRFTVLATNSGEPCLDELEVFTAGDAPRNVALASAGAKATASGVFRSGEVNIHQLDHLIDGRYGNGRSWISAESGAGWVQIELAEPATVERVVWARDREGKFTDRLPTEYRIETSTDGAEWQPVAAGDDRQPYSAETAKSPPPRVAALPADVAGEVERLEQAAGVLRAELAALAPQEAYLGTFRKPDTTYLLYRGEPMQRRQEISPGGIDAVGPLALSPEASDTERRVALARWLGSVDNPLTARVMVNRIWHYHFGAGLVATPSDLGFGGARPSHPQLLDYLATRFMATGWRPKAIHRLILLSSTYRQSSRFDEACAAADADARLLWRFPPRRLEAEAIRDRILATSGVLDLSMGGPGYDAFKANDNYVRLYEPKEVFGPAEWRRMIYQDKPRSRQDGTFGEFDCPDASQTVPRRNVSTTALQALNLLNGPFVLQQAERFAARLAREASDPDDQIRRAFRLAFGRAPEPVEQQAARQLVDTAGLAIFCRALFNANEFLYVN